MQHSNPPSNGSLQSPFHLPVFPIADKIKLSPEYNPKARQENKLYDEKRVSEICPIRPPNEELADSLVKEYQNNPGHIHTSPVEYSEQQYTLEHPKMMAMKKNSNGKVHATPKYLQNSLLNMQTPM